MSDLAALAPFHVLNVGGIGMSALVRVLAARGIAVSGSDPNETSQTAALRDLGVEVTVPPAGVIPDDATTVVSSATKPDNPDLAAARAGGSAVLHRAQLLALLVRERNVIAVSGTHGKTTTTAMIVHILRSVGRFPCFVVGSDLADEGRNAGDGDDPWAVVEADESDGSLCWLSPRVAVLTNLEPEHLDHYAGIDELTATMRAWIAAVPAGGEVIVCADDPGAMRAAPADATSYGFDAGDARLTTLDGVTTLGVDGRTHRLALPVPGAHNARNAAAAVLAARAAGVAVADAVQALASFSGTRRRFESKGMAAGIEVVDDYAHHPSEVAATLRAARTRVGGEARVIAVFEPHLYSRTRHLGAALGASLVEGADLVAILPIDGSRESPVEGITSRIVLDGALATAPRAQVGWCTGPEDALRWVDRHARPGDLVLTLGAGGITKLGPQLLDALERRRPARGRA